jgi:hypothetical protein
MSLVTRLSSGVPPGSRKSTIKANLSDE